MVLIKDKACNDDDEGYGTTTIDQNLEMLIDQNLKMLINQHLKILIDQNLDVDQSKYN